MSFESTAEGRVGVDGVDRWRKTVPHDGTADRVRERWRKTFWAFISTKKVFALTAFALSWI